MPKHTSSNSCRHKCQHCYVCVKSSPEIRKIAVSWLINRGLAPIGHQCPLTFMLKRRRFASENIHDPMIPSDAFRTFQIEWREIKNNNVRNERRRSGGLLGPAVTQPTGFSCMLAWPNLMSRKQTNGCSQWSTSFLDVMSVATFEIRTFEIRTFATWHCVVWRKKDSWEALLKMHGWYHNGFVQFLLYKPWPKTIVILS